jgi:hypothetical protein
VGVKLPAMTHFVCWAGNNPKVNPSGVRAISNQVDNTLIESLDSNKNGLQYHSPESIKNLAQKLEV